MRSPWWRRRTAGSRSLPGPPARTWCTHTGSKPCYCRAVQMPTPVSRHRWYFFSLGMVGVATLLTIVARPWLGPAIAVFFFPAVVIAAIYGGFGPGVVSGVLSTVIGVFFVVPPQT